MPETFTGLDVQAGNPLTSASHDFPRAPAAIGITLTKRGVGPHPVWGSTALNPTLAKAHGDRLFAAVHPKRPTRPGRDKTPLARLAVRSDHSRHRFASGTRRTVPTATTHHKDQTVQRRIRTTAVAFLFTACCLPASDAQTPRAELTAGATTPSPTPGDYLLRYKFAVGETIRWKVIHKTRTNTEIRGTREVAESNSESTKVWTVKRVGAEGEFTLVHSVSRINMWQRVGEQPIIRYDSESDDEVPSIYQQAAKTVGIPLSTATISASGDVLAHSSAKPIDLGLGNLVIPFPQAPLKIGEGWSVPRVVTVSVPVDGVRTYQKIKVRQRYTLRSVKTDIATIAVRTEVLTPVRDPRIESQLVQKMIRGAIRFDVQKGCLRSKTIEWNEHVVGFQGADSNMRYQASFSEQLLPARLATVRRTRQR